MYMHFNSDPFPDDPEPEDPEPVELPEPVPEFEDPVPVDPIRLVFVSSSSTLSGAQRPSPSQLNPVGQDEHAVPCWYIEAEAMLPPTA